MSLISVIIPLYNGKQYIIEAVKSVVAQQYSNWEIIIVNDGSTDTGPELVEHFISDQKLNDKIKIIHQKNQDVAAARNAGILNSKGDFIALLDQDDLFHPDKFKTVVSVYELDKSIDIFVSNRFNLDNGILKKDKGSSRKKNRIFTKKDIQPLLLTNPGVMPIDIVFSRSAFDKAGPFDTKLHVTNDWDMWIRLAQSGGKFKYIDEYLAIYRKHEENTTWKVVEKFDDERLYILNKFFETCEPQYLRFKKKAIYHAYFEASHPLYRNGSYKEYQNLMTKIILNRPQTLNFKSLKRYIISYFK